MKTWRSEYLDLKPNLSLYQIKLLENGPKSLTDAWALGAMHNNWKKIKGSMS